MKAHSVALVCVVASLVGCGGDGSVAPPACLAPAPLRNLRDPRAPDVFIRFKPGIDVNAAMSRMSIALGIPSLALGGSTTGFLAEAPTAEQIAVIRCDVAVESLEWVVVGTPLTRLPR